MSDDRRECPICRQPMDEEDADANRGCCSDECDSIAQDRAD